MLSVSSILALALALSPALIYAQTEAIGGSAVRPPILTDLQHNEKDTVHVGELVLITTTITTTEDAERQFAVIIETRHASGVTVDLQFQIGRLPPGGEAEIGVSWRPENAGEYEFRAFAISNFVEARILTGVKTSQVEIDE